MKNRHLLCLFLCVSIVVSLFSGITCVAIADSDVLEYTAVQGDYLFKVCKAHGLDYYQCKQAIMALNGFTSDVQLNKISVGQKIKLPASNAVAATVKASTATTVTTTTTIGGTTIVSTSSSTSAGIGAAGKAAAFYLVPHRVASGETLNSICDGLNTNYYSHSSMILAMNGISNAGNVWAGKTVYIPVASAPSVAGAYAVVEHTVSSGETLTSICSKYGVDYPSNAKLISGLNTGKDISKIYVGQTVYIPTKVSAVSGVSGMPSSSLTVAPTANTGFEISFGKVVDGSPYATVNGVVVSRAAAGSAVHVVGDPGLGFAVKSVSVLRTDTNARVDVKKNEFVMPDSDVKITLTYSEAHSVVKKVVSGNGSFACTVNGNIESYANYGDIVDITLFPNDGYSVKTKSDNYQVYYTQKGKDPAAEANRTYATRNSNGTFYFKMPNIDVDVYVEFAAASYFYINSDLPNGNLKYEVGSTAVTKAAKGATVTVTAQPAANWKISGWKLLDSANNDISAACSLKKINDIQWTFIMPGKDVIVHYDVQKTITYAISKDEGPGGTLSFRIKDQYSSNWTTAYRAKPGDTVRVVPNTNSGYTYNGVNVRYASGKVDVPIALDSENYIVFTMPDADVMVTAGWTTGNVRYSIAKAAFEHGTYEVYTYDGFTYSPGTTSEAGKTIRIHAVPDDGYVIDKIYVNDSDSWPMTNLGNGLYEFLMPNSNVTIRVAFKLSDVFMTFTKVDPETNGVKIGKISTKVDNVDIPNNSLVKGGSKIVINPPSKEDYSLDYVQVKTSLGTYSSKDNPNKIVSQGDGTFAYLVCNDDSTVEVSAVYSVLTSYKVQYGFPENGSYTITVGSGSPVSADTTAHNGEQIILTITPDTNYHVSEVLIDEAPVNDGAPITSYTFTMGMADVRTQVVFVKD